MSLMVRASRNLPIRQLHAEYEKILTRRIQRVGGTVDDAALLQLLECFRCICSCFRPILTVSAQMLLCLGFMVSLNS